MAGGHASNVYVMWTKTLDPNSPDFGFHDETRRRLVRRRRGLRCHRSGVPARSHRRPAVAHLRDLLRLHPARRARSQDGQARGRQQARQHRHRLEATALMYRDGWYYLLGTHGTCCDGANSTYNIRVGRSRKVTGPYLDNMGMDTLKGGGKLVVAASGRFVGPGHFGLLDLGDGVQKFSCHYEADLDRSGRSVLDIRPLLWKDGWPVAGDNFREGTYEIQSERSGYALELAVDFVRMASRRGGFGAPGGAARRRRRAGDRRSRRTRSGGSWNGRSASRCGGRHSSARRRPRWSRREHVRRARGSRDADSGPGPRRGVEGLAGRQHRHSPRRLHVPAAPEVDDHAGRRTPAAIPARPISRSRSPAPIARWRQPPTLRWWRFRPSPAVPNNSGASTS